MVNEPIRTVSNSFLGTLVLLRYFVCPESIWFKFVRTNVEIRLHLSPIIQTSNFHICQKTSLFIDWFYEATIINLSLKKVHSQNTPFTLLYFEHMQMDSFASMWRIQEDTHRPRYMAFPGQ